MGKWFTINIDPRGGTGFTRSKVYYYLHRPNDQFADSYDGFFGAIYPSTSDAMFKNRVYSIGTPTRPGRTCRGLYDNASGLFYAFIEGDGESRYRLPPSWFDGKPSTFTLYACWEGASSALLDKGGLVGGVAEIFYDPDSGNIYADQLLESPLLLGTTTVDGQVVAAYGPVVVPGLDTWRFEGFFSGEGGSGVQYMTADGYVLPGLKSLLETTSSNDILTIHAHATKASECLLLDGNGATTLPSQYLYSPWSESIGGAADRSEWYADPLCAGSLVSAVQTPGKIATDTATGAVTAAYAFMGYATSCTSCSDSAGNLLMPLPDPSVEGEIRAVWAATLNIAINPDGGVGGESQVYYCPSDCKFYRVADGRAVQTASVVPPARECFTFAGCRIAADDSSALAINADGTFASGFAPSSATTVYARWTRVSWRVSFGGGELPDLFVKAVGGGLYRDGDCTDAVAAEDALAESVPTVAGHVFLGVFAIAGDVTSTRYASASGHVTAAFAALAISADTTVWCVFGVMYPVTFDAEGGTGGLSDPLWYFNHVLYVDDRAVVAATWPIAVPFRECFRFNGYFDAIGAERYIDGDGEMTAELDALVEDGLAEDLALHAQWTRLTCRVTLDDAGGYGGDGVVYSLAGEAQGWTSDDAGACPIASVAVPVRPGYVFLGYFVSDVVAVDGGGNVLVPVGRDGDISLSARWRPCEYTLSFSDGSTAKTVAMGVAVGMLPTSAAAIPDGMVFGGWRAFGVELTADTLWRWTGNATAEPWFVRTDAQYLHDIVDWFDLGSDALVPVSSDSGDDRRRVAVRHYGRAAAGVDKTSCVWRNPTVTYMVVRDVTLDVTLGRAFAAVKSGGTMTVSGYMITSVRIATAVRAFPTVTISAVANEGADAINLFRANGIRILARARPQNLMNAISTGAGELQSLSLEISCQPVVLAEHMAPCASDVVSGEINVDAETEVCGASEASDKPSAGVGFAEVGVPQAGAGGVFRRWKIKVRKELE